jgi:hypothetical protein
MRKNELHNHKSGPSVPGQRLICSGTFFLGGKEMAKVRDLLSRESKERLYKLTKNLLDMQKDINIHQAMKHDSYKRVNRRIRQRGWGHND